MGRTRDILAHVYFGVSEERIWDILTNDIAVLLQRVEAMLEGLPPEEEP